MEGFIIRIAVLVAIVFGIAYGLTRAARTSRHRRLLAELDQAKERLAALKLALSGGEINQREHDELSEQVYARCRERGVPLDDDAPAGDREQKETG